LFVLWKHVLESILAQIKQVFTDENLPRVIFQDDTKLLALNDCSIYGLYNGRSHKEDEDIIYFNEEVH
jgi:ferredoxin-fold anticodon binding domain-containing protein